MGAFIKSKRAIRSLKKGTEQLGGATQISHRKFHDSLFLSHNAGNALQFAAGLRGRLGYERYKGLSAYGLLSGIHHHLLVLFNVLFLHYEKDCMVDFTLFANVCQVGPACLPKYFLQFPQPDCNKYRFHSSGSTVSFPS